MLVPVYQVGRKLPKEIKNKIKRKEYSVGELNNIYKILLKSEKNYGSNLTTNAVVLPKTKDKEKMKQNIDIFDFELTRDKIDKIKTLDENKSLWLEYDGPNIVEMAMS